ncbi:MAG: DNA polymerase III subunit gamma/tau [Oscillospiraceae bacterium]
MALYRKWRPKTFSDVLSQTHITSTLQNQITQNRIAHSYLFTGPRGTGKTTCSKILAMAVNCLNPTDGNPCMECEACKAIEDGGTLDVCEIDAASNNGVDNIRELRDEANFTPAFLKYRVYIIDEVHMLSIGAFNALLKIMEEPPKHVIFILATTEAHKVPATITSRCQRFDFKRILMEDIVSRLLYIATQENVLLQPDAAQLIARLADGGMRDALSILDQCIAYSQEVTVKTVQDSTGIVDDQYLFTIAQYINEKKTSELLCLISEIYGSSKDLTALLSELVNHFRNTMLAKTLEKPNVILKLTDDEIKKLKAQQFSLEKLLTIISVLQECMDKMSKSIDKRLCLELYMVKLSSTVSVDFNNNSVKNDVSTPTATRHSTNEDNINNNSSNNTSIGAKVQKVTQNDMPKLVALTDWAEVLGELSKIYADLGGMLHSSKAYISQEDILYLESPIDFISEILKQESNAAKLMSVVYKVTGKKFRLRILKKTKSDDMVDNNGNNSLLENLLNNAQKEGIDINNK